MVPVLMYHSIGGKASYLTVSRRLFAEQMRALKVAGFHTLTIGQYAHFVKHGYQRAAVRARSCSPSTTAGRMPTGPPTTCSRRTDSM